MERLRHARTCSSTRTPSSASTAPTSAATRPTIERSVGCKITIRATEAEAERVRRDILEHNRTPLERVAGDATFWTGTPEQIAETMIGYRRIGFHTFLVEHPAPYDAETMETLIQVVKPMVEAAPVPS